MEEKKYFTDKLTPEQQKFAKADFNKPCFSVAVAGSGKTTSCVARIEQMILAGIDPHDILLLSFTKTSARSIVNKVKKTLGEDKVDGITHGTFHSVFNRILRKYSKVIGLDNNYVLQVDEVLTDAMKLAFENVDFPKGRGCPTASRLLVLIHNLKLRKIGLGEALEVYRPEWIEYYDDIIRAIKEYGKYCRENRILDYDDILLKTQKLITENPDIRDKVAEKYKYIIVDEYQDTNVIQADIIYELLKSPTPPSITIVGDPNQSIYSFINADINNILSFKNKFPNATEASLTYNFRSNQQILNTCNAIMEEAHSNLFYRMKGVKSVEYRPTLCSFTDSKRQASGVINTINYLVNKKGLKPNDIAVLMRNSISTTQLELEIKAHTKYNYIIKGGRKFLESACAQDVLQFLEVVDETDVNISWLRTLSLFDNIGPKKAIEIVDKLTTTDSKIDINLIDNSNFNSSLKYWKSLVYFKQICEEARKKKSVKETVNYIVDFWINKTENQIQKRNGVNLTEELEKLDNNKLRLNSLCSMTDEYSSLREFLDALVLDDSLSEEETSENTLILSTIHSAKGLEWKAVIFMDVTEGVLPGKYRYPSNRPLALELTRITYEEGRRLCYVACTRAKDYLFIFYPRLSSGSLPINPSPFIYNERVLNTMHCINEYELNSLLRN